MGRLTSLFEQIPPPLINTAKGGISLKAIFRALIKEVKSKSLVSGDKAFRILLETNDLEPDVVDKINRLHKPDEFISVALVDNDE